MRKSADLDSVSAREDVASRAVITSSDDPIVILRRGSAGNDTTYEGPKISDSDAWARHALAANGFGEGAGFGDGAIIDAPSAPATSYELYRDARAHRSFTLGEIIIATIQAVADFSRRARARHRQRR